MAALERHVSWPSLALIGIVGAVGTGVLFSTAGMAAVAGPSVILAWAIAVVIYIPIAIVLIRLAVRFPEAGGPARYPIYTHGASMTLLASVADVVWFLFIPPIESLALVEGINSFYPHFLNSAGNPTFPGALAAVGGVLLMLPVNYYGIRLFTNLTNWGGALKVLLYLTVPLAFVTFAELGNFSHYGGFMPFGGGGLFQALPLAAFGLGGIRAIINFAEEMRDSRQITKAVIGSLIGQGIIDVLFGVAFVFGLNWAHAGVKAGDWAAISTISGNPFLVLTRASSYSWLVPIVTIVAILGPFITGYIYQGSGARTVVAMGRTKLAGNYIGGISDQRRIPARALIMFTIVGVILAFLMAPVPKIYGLIDDAVVAGYAALVPIPVVLLTLGRRQGGVSLADRVWATLAMAVASLIVYWSGWPSVPYSMIAIAVIAIALGAWTRPAHLSKAVWFIAFCLFTVLMAYIGDVGKLHVVSLAWGTLIVAVVSVVVFMPWGILSGLTEQEAAEQGEAGRQWAVAGGLATGPAGAAPSPQA